MLSDNSSNNNREIIMNKIVLYNLIPTQPLRSKRHGGGRYGECVIRRVIMRNYPVICIYDSKKWLNPEIKGLIEKHHIKLYDINDNSISDIVKSEGVQTYYTPMVNKNSIGEFGCKMVGTIHGLRSMEMPTDKWYCKYKGWKNTVQYLVYLLFGKVYRKKISRFLSDTLRKDNFFPVTVSQHSAYSLKIWFQDDIKKRGIPVFYSPSTNVGKEITTPKYSEKYVLLVSAFVPFKNGLRAIVALDRLFSAGNLKDVKVKVTGLSSPQRYCYKVKNPDKFDFLGFVSDEELEQLYHDAYCLVYPSLNEGFGYPPVEAMHYGVPVLASPFTSITEVCADAAIYFNPFSIEEIMGRILFIMNEDVRKLYSTKALEQYKKIHLKQEEDLNKLVDYIFSV